MSLLGTGFQGGRILIPRIRNHLLLAQPAGISPGLTRHAMQGHSSPLYPAERLSTEASCGVECSNTTQAFVFIAFGSMEP